MTNVDDLDVTTHYAIEDFVRVAPDHADANAGAVCYFAGIWL